MIQPADPKPLKVPTWWYLFLQEYMRNGGNARAAYMVARPKVSEESAGPSSVRLLNNVKFQELLKVEKEKLAAKIDYSREEWMGRFVNVARFDVSMLFDFDADLGEFRLRADAMEIARKHGALESVESVSTTLESGQVVQRLKTKAYSAMEANEKIGKILGYDKTEEPKTVITQNNRINVINQIQIVHDMTSKGELASPSDEDIGKLIEAEVE